MEVNIKQRDDNPMLSFLVPVYNEENSIEIFIKSLSAVATSENWNYEVVFINDGSIDNTLNVLLNFLDIHKNIKVINLSRNFGKELALSAGIDYAKGDVLIPIDVDLQDPPELVKEFLRYWVKGYDIVYGQRISRVHDNFIKRTTSEWFYKLFNKLSKVKIPENVGDFRLIDKRVADVIRKLPERNRFMKGLFAWVGFSSIGVPYERPTRVAGATKWNHWKLWNFALDGISGFSTVPLRIWIYVGLTVSAVTFIYGLFIVTRTFIFGIDVPGYASLIVAFLFIGGIQLLSVGVLGEYLGRVFIEVKGRPLYVVESIYPDASA